MAFEESSMKLLRIGIVLGIFSISLAAGDKENARYHDLVERVKAGDMTVDFKELRFACLKAEGCDPRGDPKDLVGLRRAYQEQQFERALKIAEGLIDKGYANIEAHMTCAKAYENLGQQKNADRHMEIGKALVGSILASGDGKTKETAFEVIGTHEEYIAVLALGLPRPTLQGLMMGKPHSYDRLEVDDPKSGQKIALFFNIDAFFPTKGL
jgi:hypothetical protein